MTQGPLFIVGSERSGTTMLRLMLNELPSLFIPKESHFIEPLVQNFPRLDVLSEYQLEQVLSLVVEMRRWQEWGDDAAELRRAVQQASPMTLAETIDLIFRFSGGYQGEAIWGDKTPKYVHSMAEIGEVFPAAKFIHIVRDGRDVCVSMLNTQWYGGSIRKIAELWRSSVLAAKKAELLLGSNRSKLVRYEELVSNSQKVLEEITSFIGIDYDARMLEFYKNSGDKVAARERMYHPKIMRKPSAQDVDRWRRELSALQVLVYESVAGDLLESYGYRLKFSGVRRIFPWVIGVIFKLADWSLPFRKKLGIHFPKISKNY